MLQCTFQYSFYTRYGLYLALPVLVVCLLGFGVWVRYKTKACWVNRKYNMSMKRGYQPDLETVSASIHTINP